MTSPRRAHSIAAQGGINASKNLIQTMAIRSIAFFTTQLRAEIFVRAKPMFIGSPKFQETSSINVSLKVFLLRVSTVAFWHNRSFGGAQYRALFMLEGKRGSSFFSERLSSFDEASGSRKILKCLRASRNARACCDRRCGSWHCHSEILITGELECHEADAVVLATGGYGNVFYLSTNAKNLKRHRRMALL